MNIINVTDSDMTLCNCTTNDKDDTNIEIVIPLITIIPCVISLIGLLSLMIYTLIKPLFNKKTTL